jgi:hypothetical protein
MKNILGIMLLGLMVLFISPPSTAETLKPDLIVYSSGYCVTEVDVTAKSVELVSVPVLTDSYVLRSTSVANDSVYLDDDVGWIGSKVYNYSKELVTSPTAYKDVPLLVPLKMNSSNYIYLKGNDTAYNTYRDLPLLVPLKLNNFIS